MAVSHSSLSTERQSAATHEAGVLQSFAISLWHIAEHRTGMDGRGLHAWAGSFPNFNQRFLNGAPGAHH
jgi:hypothetical protein